MLKITGLPVWAGILIAVVYFVLIFILFVAFIHNLYTMITTGVHDEGMLGWTVVEGLILLSIFTNHSK